MAASLGIQSWIEGGVIAAVVILNVVVGFFQDYNAAKTMDSLRSLSSPTAQAVRNGNNEVVPTSTIVPGDMVELKTGDTVPADLRLVEAVNFETDEALLTGESLPVRKEVGAIFDSETGPGDRLNVAYSSSTVTKGRARGVVYATGLYTEIGQIAAALHGKDSKRRQPKRKADGTTAFHRWTEAWILTFWDAVGRFLGTNVGTPLQKKLSKLALILLGTAIVCAIIVLAANRFNTRQEVIIYAVATGLSMIPASLIVVLTITMAAGTKTMVRRQVIVRNLRSVEALGAVTSTSITPLSILQSLSSRQISAPIKRAPSPREKWLSKRLGFLREVSFPSTPRASLSTRQLAKSISTRPSRCILARAKMWDPSSTRRKCPPMTWP